MLNEKAAIDRGADAVGELATFVLVAAPVIGVYWYEDLQKDAEKLKKEQEQAVRLRRLSVSYNATISSSYDDPGRNKMQSYNAVLRC